MIRQFVMSRTNRQWLAVYVAVNCQHTVYITADEWPQSETLLARQI